MRRDTDKMYCYLIIITSFCHSSNNQFLNKSIDRIMTLETILQILYANNMTEVIVLATQIDLNIAEDTKQPGDMIKVQVSKEALRKMNLQPAENSREEYRFTIELPVITVNKYALKRKYLVDMGGKSEWVEETDRSLTAVEFIPEATDEPKNISEASDIAW